MLEHETRKVSDEFKNRDIIDETKKYQLVMKKILFQQIEQVRKTAAKNAVPRKNFSEYCAPFESRRNSSTFLGNYISMRIPIRET